MKESDLDPLTSAALTLALDGLQAATGALPFTPNGPPNRHTTADKFRAALAQCRVYLRQELELDREAPPRALKLRIGRNPNSTDAPGSTNASGPNPGDVPLPLDA